MAMNINTSKIVIGNSEREETNHWNQVQMGGYYESWQRNEVCGTKRNFCRMNKVVGFEHGTAPSSCIRAKSFLTSWVTVSFSRIWWENCSSTFTNLLAKRSMLRIRQNVAACSRKSTELHSYVKRTPPPHPTLAEKKTVFFIIEPSDTVTIPEFLEGTVFESWEKLASIYSGINGLFGHARQVRLSDVTSSLLCETAQLQT
jgi:hypothetical protein